jgi:hypothetical protein
LLALQVRPFYQFMNLQLSMLSCAKIRQTINVDEIGLTP